MDYRDDYRTIDNTETYKKMRDQLARIACKALTELERIDPANKLFKDKEAGPWFTQHKIDDARAKEAERARRAKIKAEKEAKALALSKLTEADKKALGIR
jgi:hypothetical protein